MATIVKKGNSYYVVFRESGKQIWKKAGRRRKDAEYLRTEIERRQHLGEYLNLPDITFAELAEKWKQVHTGRVRLRTMRGYETHLRRHLIPYFGKHKVKTISAEMIERFISELLSTGLSPKTVGYYLKTLKLVLKQGIIWGYLSRNPSEFVKSPKVTAIRETNFLTPEEMQALIDAALPKHKALIAMACLTGIRQGELLALSWDDIDFRSNRIHIKRAVSSRKIQEPKSQYSRRVINVPETLIGMLKEHRVRLLVELPENPDNLVFPNERGHLMDHSSLLRYIFWPTLRRAGLPKIRFHDLRHSFASMLIHRGENIKYVQRVLGHSSVQITLDIYGHLLPDAGQEVAERLEEFFFSDLHKEIKK